ncbi:HGS [Cordylochernes scorpioides]|uniref:Hepatocyte growth factor-regulated tyrosine kinase substrate n=1 Tax=Cordylochernes scorpioides TaxID=51811 RepID=A0ABY6L833_9ARAC|nr:HGS [Cordylochernes scorpioides]
MFRSHSNFDKLVEKATSPLLLEIDWTVVLQICDSIRQGDVPPNSALNTIRKKIWSPNPHVALYALQVLESCVKNCGTPFHAVVATKDFMDDIRDHLKKPTNDRVRRQLLELIQTWAHAFRNEPKYNVVSDLMNRLKTEGHSFPALKPSDALFIADIAPQWIDGSICYQCRTQFGIMQRKHHCRNCGHVYCNRCSSKTSTIPRFGIEKRVRVCDACYDRLQQGAPRTSPKVSSAPTIVPQSNLLSQEEEDLQLALALSKSEQESKEIGWRILSSQKLNRSSSDSLLTNRELNRYLDRDYWERRGRKAESAPSSPTTEEEVEATILPKEEDATTSSKASVEDNEEASLQGFISSFRSTLEIFVYRMTNDCTRGRSIVEDNFVQTIFLNICDLHSKLIVHITETDKKRNWYEGLQEKIAQIKDARAALDSLRQEHNEERRRQAEAAERQRQRQMADKLQLMRAKKREYFEHQRQLAIRRFQEQSALGPTPIQPTYMNYPPPPAAMADARPPPPPREYDYWRPPPLHQIPPSYRQPFQQLAFQQAPPPPVAQAPPFNPQQPMMMAPPQTYFPEQMTPPPYYQQRDTPPPQQVHGQHPPTFPPHSLHGHPTQGPSHTVPSPVQQVPSSEYQRLPPVQHPLHPPKKEEEEKPLISFD